MHDVVVIGAGLAGLRCAAVLAERGLEVVVLEAADTVGGRQRTDIVDGFRLDRGFQVLNPAYPALRRSVDLDALALRSFPVGVQVRTDRGVAAVRHPLRHPSSIARTIGSGLVSAADAVAFARWLAPAFTRRLSDRARDDRPLREAWDAAGLRGPLRTAVLEPFLAGVVAEADGVTSNAFVQELVRYFARGRPGLPAQGIAAVPAQLAARARAAGAEIRLGARAERVERDGPIVEVDVAGGEALRAGRVVVAVGPETVAELTPVPRPATNGLQTWWFAATHAPSASALLRVDGRGGGRRGPVVNTAVISHTAPSYAPAGRHLIEATCLLPRGVATAGEDEVRRHLAELWDAEVTDWQLLRRDDIPDALPTQPSPLRAPRQPRVADRVYLAGDHRDAASIQGALASGERAARAVLVDAGGVMGAAEPLRSAGLIVLQVIVSFIAYGMVVMQTLSIDGCGYRCDFTLVTVASRAALVVSVVAALVSVVIVVARGIRPSWWAPVGGIALVVVTTGIALSAIHIATQRRAHPSTPGPERLEGIEAAPPRRGLIRPVNALTLCRREFFTCQFSNEVVG